MIRVGIIGYGIIGQAHAQHFLAGRIKGAGISAVCNRGDERRAIAKTDLGEDVALFTSYKDMIDSHLIDAVIIATPHLNHEEVTRYALEKGIHVLVEKPLGSYTLQAVRMNKTALENKETVYAIMFNQRSIPVFLKMKSIIDSGGIGDLKRFVWIATNAYRPDGYFKLNEWRGTWEFDGGGILLNQAPHQLDMWAWLAGMPQTIRARCHFGSHRSISVEDDVSAYFEYANGATGIFVTGTHEFPGTNRLEISGSKGRLVMEQHTDTKTQKNYRTLIYDEYECDERDFNNNSVNTAPNSRYNFEYDYKRYEFDDHSLAGEYDVTTHQHANIINDFIDSIINHTPLLSPGTDGINSLRLANAMYLSEWTDAVIDLDNFDDDLYYKKYAEQIEKERAGSLSSTRPLRPLP